jgi:ssDNA-binding replication factor A large subunit
MEQNLVDKYISVIISSRPDISREQLLKMIEERSKKVKIGNNYKKLYTLFLVAQELGIKLEQASLAEQAVKIGNILPNLRSVTLIGRVIGIS